MKKLFENTNADFCKLIDYVKILVDKEEENS